MSNKSFQNDACEHAFCSVPDCKKKSLLSITCVLAGYPIALSNFVIGGAVGVGLTFPKALLALLIGNIVLVGILLSTGFLAYKTGLSTSFLSRRAFGKNGSSILSALLVITSVTWIALNGDIFARLIKSTFSWWPLTVPITAIIVIVLWAQSAIRGYKGLESISFLGLPAALIMALVSIIAVSKNIGFADLMSYIPSTPITFTATTSAIVGAWIFGATITPDVARFANSKRDLIIAGVVAFVTSCLGTQLAGVLVGIATVNGDFTVAMRALGLSFVAFVAAVFCLWTTQNNNIYGAGLAIQNILNETSFKGKVTHKHIAIGVSIVAAILASMGIYKYILPIIKFISLLIPPVPGLIIAEEVFIKKSKENINTNVVAIVSWLIAGVASYISLKQNFFIPPIIGIVVSCSSYLIISKIFNKEVEITVNAIE